MAIPSAIISYFSWWKSIFKILCVTKFSHSLQLSICFELKFILEHKRFYYDDGSMERVFHKWKFLVEIRVEINKLRRSWWHGRGGYASTIMFRLL